MLRAGAVAVIGAIATAPAFAADCSAAGSDADRTLCAFGRARAAHTRMLERLDYALRAAKRASETLSTPDVGPDLRATQGDWQAWMERQCRLEGDVTPGSGAGQAEAACIERLARERAESLETIAERLGF